jgi:hypothetical protein
MTGVYDTTLDETLCQGSAMAGYHQAHNSRELKDARKKAGEWLKKLRTHGDSVLRRTHLERVLYFNHSSFC